MNIIDPSTIDLLTLASASLEQRDKLPTTPCVYRKIGFKAVNLSMEVTPHAWLQNRT